jgi:type IV pilus assembly protein PilB
MRLVDLLISSGIITGEQLEQALALPREDGQRLGDVLIRQGVISEAQLIDALRVQLGVDFVDLTAVSIPVELAKYVPRNLAKKFLVAPVKLVQDRLYLAMHDPLDFVAQDEVKTASRKRIIPMIATRKAVEQAIERLYGSEGTARVIEEMKREAGAGEDIIPAQMARDTADPEASAPTIRFVNSLIERAFTERASDIHLEPQEGEMLVRMRIDGQLPLVLPVRMQGVLGIANTSVPETPAYKQGIMTRAGDAFLADTSAPLYSAAPYTDTPAYTGAPLYLYGQGSAADLTAANEDGSYRFTLSAAAVTVGAGTDAVTYDALSGTADYRIIEGAPQSLPDTLFTVRPLTVKGKQPGPVTLTVTLMDTEGHAFTLSIPYTLTEEDTRVTATLRVDEQAFTLSVPYGTAPTAEDVARLLTDNGIPLTNAAVVLPSTEVFTRELTMPALTDSGGAPTVPDADTPASGSKDPEDTPSDDPSAPDSSSSGTDPTPEPSPDTLP